MTTGYTFEISCPRCGLELDHRDSTSAGETMTSAEAFCSTCLVVWSIDVVVSPIFDFGDHAVAGEDAARDRAGSSIGVDVMSAFS